MNAGCDEGLMFGDIDGAAIVLGSSDESIRAVVGLGFQGAEGIPGAGYVHTQMSASASWLITHNLSRFPSVTVVDSAGTVLEGDILYIDNKNIQLDFSAPFAGEAYLN